MQHPSLSTPRRLSKVDANVVLLRGHKRRGIALLGPNNLNEALIRLFLAWLFFIDFFRNYNRPEATGLCITLQLNRSQQELYITAAMLDRWFTPSKSEKSSYGDRLAQMLSITEVQAVAEAFQRHLLHQTVQWESAIVFICATVNF